MLDVGNTDEHKEDHLYSSHHSGIFPIIFLVDATYIPINIRSKLFTYVYYVKHMVICLHKYNMHR